MDHFELHTDGRQHHRFLEIFRLAALQAGSVARRLQGEIRLRSKKGQTSVEGEALTAVDLASQDVILRLLHHFFPDIGIDAEEETETVGLFGLPEESGPFVVVDPIDGTLNYSRGSREYAVMGAWVEDGIYRAAVVHFPDYEEMFWATAGEGSWKQKGLGSPERIGISHSSNRVLVNPSAPPIWHEKLREMGYEVSVSRCSGVDATAAAAGRACAAVSFGRLGRRRSIGFLVTLEAGGTIMIGSRRWKGEDPLTISTTPETPKVAASSRETAERIVEALS